MLQQWYYAQNGQRHGPVSVEQLKQLAVSGGLQPSDLVWKEGMSQWTEARRIKGLFPAQVTPSPQSTTPIMPPPLPPAATGQSAIPTGPNGRASVVLPADQQQGPLSAERLRQLVISGFFLRQRVKLTVAGVGIGLALAFVSRIFDHLSDSPPTSFLLTGVAGGMIALGISLSVEVEVRRRRKSIQQLLGSLTKRCLCPFLALFVALQLDLLRSSEPPKVAAFRQVIAALKQAPDEYATGTELTHCLEQLRSVLNAYEAIPLDVDRNPEVAKTIVRLYSTQIEGRYRGHIYDTVDEDVRILHSKLLAK